MRQHYFSPITTIMPQLVPNTNRPRRDAIYSKEEMVVLGKYKDEYKTQTTKEMRKHAMKKILLAIFTYWDDRGNIAADEEDNTDRARVVLSIFIFDPSDCDSEGTYCMVRNNWRPEPTTKFVNPNLKITAINVVWDLHKDLVEEELRNILGVDRLEDGDPRIFQQRNAAAKRVLLNMDEADRIKVYGLVELRRTQGNPEHIQRK